MLRYLLLFSCLACPGFIWAQNEKHSDTLVVDAPQYVSDTITSYTVETEDEYFADEWAKPDTVITISKNKDLMVFLANDVFAAFRNYYTPGILPLKQWTIWRLNKGEYPNTNIYIDFDHLSICNDMKADIGYVRISGKKLLRINWQTYTCGISGPWTTTKGMQLWDLQTMTCYFDEITNENTEWSGRYSMDEEENRFDIYTIDYKIKNGKLKIRENTFYGGAPKPGTYRLKGGHLVRKKGFLWW